MARGEGLLVTLSTCPRPCPRGPGPGSASSTVCASRGPALCIVRCLPKQPLTIIVIPAQHCLHSLLVNLVHVEDEKVYICVATRCLILATLLLRSCVISLQNLRMLRILALELIVSDGLAGPLRSCCLVELPPVELQFCRAGNRIGAWAALMHAVALPHLWSSACPRPLLMAPMPARAWLLQALALEAALLLQKPWRSSAFASVPQPSLAAPTTHSP